MLDINNMRIILDIPDANLCVHSNDYSVISDKYTSNEKCVDNERHGQKKPRICLLLLLFSCNCFYRTCIIIFFPEHVI